MSRKRERVYAEPWKKLRARFEDAVHAKAEDKTVTVRMITSPDLVATIYKGIQKEKFMDSSWPYGPHVRLFKRIESGPGGGATILVVGLEVYRKGQLMAALLENS